MYVAKSFSTNATEFTGVGAGVGQGNMRCRQHLARILDDTRVSTSGMEFVRTVVESLLSIHNLGATRERCVVTIAGPLTAERAEHMFRPSRLALLPLELLMSESVGMNIFRIRVGVMRGIVGLVRGRKIQNVVAYSMARLTQLIREVVLVPFQGVTHVIIPSREAGAVDVTTHQLLRGALDGTNKLITLGVRRSLT